MLHDFQLTLLHSGLPGLPGPRIKSARGVSVGRSPDGSATVAILGAKGLEEFASRQAIGYVQGARSPVACATGEIGAVVLDHTTGTVTAVAAPIGLRQIFWATAEDAFNLASNPRDLPTAHSESRSIRPEALFDYIYFHMLPGPAGVYSGTSKLDGGHWLRWDGKGTTLTRYWRPVFDDAPLSSEPEAATELMRVLRDSVGRAIGSRTAVGAFLSGGLDSSTVAGLAAQHRPGLPTITMGFDAAGYDETEYARIASKHFGTRPLEYYVSPEDVLETLPMIAAAFPEPFGNSSAAAAYHCARIAREHGLELLLAGDGGDELFGGNERYAKQMVFERYAQAPGALRRILLEPLVGAASRVTTAFPIGKAQSYIQQANVPLPDRLQSYNFLHRHVPTEVFTPDLLVEVDASAPLRSLREEYDIPCTDSAVNRMLFLDWKFTLHDNDLVKVNAMCQLAGVEVAYPMLDQAVVEFSLRVPGDWKVRDGQLRWLYKRAMQGFLPQPIIAKTKHGFGLPFGVWTRTHMGLRRLSEDALESLSHRGYFRPAFLREALRLHREGHASYYGELVWILIALELWLQANTPGATLHKPMVRGTCA